MTSLRLVPPVETMHWTFMCFPSSFTKEEVCSTSSRVGTKMSPWMSRFAVEHRSSSGMAKAPVSPVPL